MGILNSLFGKAQPVPDSIRDTLFGDMPIDRWPGNTAATEFPWDAFAAARAHLASGHRDRAVANWRQILDRPGLEPRHYLQAWHFLKQNGEHPSPDVAKQLLGVVVEVALPEGVDLLAAYPDYSARYYNYSGAGVVWDHPDQSLNGSIDALLTAARGVVAQIGPWEEARPPVPRRGNARLSFLTPSGLHFGEGPMSALSQDALAGNVLQLATTVMTGLIAKTNVR